MQVKKRLSAILSTFIKLPFVIKIFVLSIFEWSLKTGFTVFHIGIVCLLLWRKKFFLFVCFSQNLQIRTPWHNVHKILSEPVNIEIIKRAACVFAQSDQRLCYSLYLESIVFKLAPCKSPMF